MKYCNNCKQNVVPTKKFSIVWFLINCLWLIGGIVYIIYFFAMKKKVCPICHGNDLEHEHSNEEIGIENLLPTPTISEIAQQNLNKAIEEEQKAKDKYQIAKDTTAETIRKRKAGELPWQIKAAEKKLAKEQKKLSKV